MHERKHTMNVYCYGPTPVGTLTLASDDRDRLCGLAFGEPTARDLVDATLVSEPYGVIAETVRQLEEYFARTRREFELELAAEGTDFQLAVWSALLRIPYGETMSYGEMARAVGRPTAFRAVGQANGRNPIAIVVPCHRVIGSDQSLTGFGGGIDNKRVLLALEGAIALTPALEL
jgi:methylated-DNA-[protein]-cysteine S-methyltransferase